MFARLKSLVAPLSQADRELVYLNASQDRYDLEMRQREIDRGLFRRKNNFPF